ncbi:MAG: hypothetical protein JXA79_03845 [Deltaproteobacteria bacterium]|nr:hypothetical protein [Deltaproteobacteria bacterium]
MDDEKDVKDAAAETLSYIGYKVVTALDGREAINLYKAAKEEGKAFSDVILDLTVPGEVWGPKRPL